MDIFLGLVGFLGKYDAVIQEHIRHVNSNEMHFHHLGKNIQNEMIQLYANAIQRNILKSCKRAKYFSFILDCTPDVSHVEQMPLTIRFIELDPEVTIKEHFLMFIPVERSSGLKLTSVLLETLDTLGLDIQNCRGQGFDNGSNMKGRHSGVQARILKLNPRSFFVPCGCRNLNLVVADAAKSSVKSISFFGLIQALYVFFSASTIRWKILKDHLKKDGLTLKPLSATRWEAQINGVKAVRYQIGEVYDALYEVTNEKSGFDAVLRHEAESLANQLKNFPFLVSLIAWYDILFRINVVSKVVQNKSMVLQSAAEMIESTMQFLIKFRNTGFYDCVTSANELASELELTLEFTGTMALRARRKSSFFQYESKDDPVQDPETKFRVEFFNVLVDTAMTSLQERFGQMKQHIETFGFLFNISALKNLNSEIWGNCRNLENKLLDNETSDINASDLCSELQMLAELLPPDLSPLDTLMYINKKLITRCFT